MDIPAKAGAADVSSQETADPSTLPMLTKPAAVLFYRLTRPQSP
jgi:hypothetical protein